MCVLYLFSIRSRSRLRSAGSCGSTESNTLYICRVQESEEEKKKRKEKRKVKFQIWSCLCRSAYVFKYMYMYLLYSSTGEVKTMLKKKTIVIDIASTWAEYMVLTS